MSVFLVLFGDKVLAHHGGNKVAEDANHSEVLEEAVTDDSFILKQQKETGRTQTYKINDNNIPSTVTSLSLQKNTAFNKKLHF